MIKTLEALYVKFQMHSLNYPMHNTGAYNNQNTVHSVDKMKYK